MTEKKEQRTRRVLIYLMKTTFFLIFLLVPFFSLVTLSFFSFFLSSFGICFISFRFSKAIAKKTGLQMSIILRIVILVVCIYFSLFLLNPVGNDGSANEPSADGVGPELTMKKYLDTLNYADVYELLSQNERRMLLSSGALHDVIERDNENIKEIETTFSNLKQQCTKAISLNIISNCTFLKLSSLYEQVNVSINVVSSSLLSESDVGAKVLVQRNDSSSNYSLHNTTYFLEKRSGVWKVTDYIDDEGILLSEKNISDTNLINNTLRPYRETLHELNTLILAAERYGTIKKNMNKALQRELGDNLISSHFGYVPNSTDQYVVSVVYYHEPAFLGDDYVVFLSQATEVLEIFFRTSYHFENVSLYVIEKYADDYGHYREKQVGRVVMDRKTAKKINWDGFESSNLDKITVVSFSGNSLYFDLKALQKELNRLQTINSNLYSVLN